MAAEVVIQEHFDDFPLSGVGDVPAISLPEPLLANGQVALTVGCKDGGFQGV